MGKPPRTRHARRGVRAAGLFACVVTCAVGATGCTDGDGEPPPPRERPDAALEIRLVEGASSLTSKERDQVQASIGEVLSSYVVDAFLGEYPRDDFVDALDSFTSGVATRAARHLETLTAARYAEADGVRARRLLTRVSTFATDGIAVGATARIDFRFVVRGEATGPGVVKLTGRLAMAPEEDGWRIFGYDVRRQDPPTDRRAVS